MAQMVSRIIAAAVLLACLPCMLAARYSVPAPVPQEPGVLTAQDDQMNMTYIPLKNTTCAAACQAMGLGWDSLFAGTPNRTMCRLRLGRNLFVYGTAQFQQRNKDYACQYQESGKTTVKTVRNGFECACAYACAGLGYSYDWNYDNNHNGGAPKPYDSVDYEVSPCRTAFWSANKTSTTPSSSNPNKCDFKFCKSGCMCRYRVRNGDYITGYIDSKKPTTCNTPKGPKTKDFNIFFQCRNCSGGMKKKSC